jgi:hypothetical protein
VFIPFLSLFVFSFIFVFGFHLLGPKTDPESKKTVREAIEKGEDVSVILLNYRKDGSTFHNQLFIAPLRDNHGKVVNFLGVQCLVTSRE